MMTIIMMMPLTVLLMVLCFVALRRHGESEGHSQIIYPILGLSNVDRLYENVPKLWSQWVFSDQVDTQLLPPKFGDSSGVRGAAWLWAEGE